MRSLPARPAPGGAATWWTTDQQPGHPDLGVSRKQESGHQAAITILTVVAIADRSHRRHQARPFSAVGEGPGGELHSMVGVNDHTDLRVAVGDRHAQRVGDEGGGLTRIDRPADHTAGEGIEYDRAVQLALVGLNFVDRRNAGGLCVF